MSVIRIKLNIDLKKVLRGTVLTLQLDPWGNVKDKFWRRRIRDSVIDGCVEVLTEVKAEEIKAVTKKLVIKGDSE